MGLTSDQYYHQQLKLHITLLVVIVNRPKYLNITYS